MDYLSDESIDGMLAENDEDYGAQAAMMAPPAPPQMEVPLYPLSLAQAPVQAPQQPGGIVGIASKKLGPLPLWAWLLIGGGAAGTGYFMYQTTKKKDGASGGDGGESESSPRPKLGDILSMNDGDSERGSGGGWEPSRSRFVEQLNRYFQRKGQLQHVTVWVDADEARDKGKLKFVSPLVNVQVMGGAVKVDGALQRFARREGLNPTQHDDGSIGFYPHTGKRGKGWEEYVDALRDEGQKV